MLGELWRRREERRPVLIVVDEAHNVCPARPEDPLTAIATEYAVRIAGEGRKFGLYLLVSTQRPQKVHENVLSQCDNLLLMRMNSLADLGFVSEVFSFVPQSLLERATTFRQGESLVAGLVSPHPALIRFGRRLAQEGGGDVPADWSRPLTSAGFGRLDVQHQAVHRDDPYSMRREVHRRPPAPARARRGHGSDREAPAPPSPRRSRRSDSRRPSAPARAASGAAST